MNLETFFSNFELFADAPNGVQKLRELILQLAVQGKLVPQNPDDEPAAVLLEKIKEEKERLVKEGKIKKSKKLPSVDVGEMAFDLPEGWEWVRFENIILSITGGGTPSKNNPQFWNGTIPWASVKDLKEKKYLEKTIDYITEEAIKKSSTNLIPKNRIIVCTRMGLGKIAINKIDLAINQDLKALQLPKEIDINYFYNCYLTLDIVGTGVTVSGIRQSELLNLAIPLPPLNEQHRIVAKVDALMKLCDELETRSQNKRDRILKLGEVATTKLLTPTTKKSFNQHWKTISDNFDLLYSTPENVKQLRQAILQLAVMGKLVPQNPDDEPASVLLEKIKEEKERLVKEGKIKKSKELELIDVEELEYNIPKQWNWLRLADICELITDGTHQTPKYTLEGRIFLSAQNVKPFQFMPEKHRFVSEEDYQGYIKNRKPEFEDILLTRVGAGIGEAAVIDQSLDFAIYVSIALIRPFKNFIDPYYLTIWLNSPSGTHKSSINTYGKGVSQGNLNLGLIRKFVVSVPPLNEQHRIVTKVNQMMSLCDELEAKLTQSIGDRDKLMSAAVRQVLAA